MFQNLRKIANKIKVSVNEDFSKSLNHGHPTSIFGKYLFERPFGAGDLNGGKRLFQPEKSGKSNQCMTRFKLKLAYVT